MARWNRCFGVRAADAHADVDGERFVARFGRWMCSTPVTNVATAQVTGPYRWWKVVGPPRMSLVDRGLTFATTAAGGVCLTFREPVAVLVPFLRHPGLTVTVADPEGLLAALRQVTALD